MTKTTQNAIKAVFGMLKNRDINPTGTFDDAGRWYAENDDLIDVRSPSRSYPYPEMVACRTKKYVTAVAEKFGCKTKKTILQHV